MTIEEFASLANAKKVGKGKYMAFCPAHKDRNRSLAINLGKRRTVWPFVIRCMSQGCSAESILRAMGLRWSDVLSGEGVITPEVRRKMRDQDRLKKVQMYLMAFILNKTSMDTENRYYWASQEARAEQEIWRLRNKLGLVNL